MIADSIPTHTVFVQNVGCDATVVDPCPMPWGAPTEVELVAGGEIGGFDLVVFESSSALVRGGTIWGDLEAWDASTVELRGGQVYFKVTAGDSSTLTIRGGTIGGGAGWGNPRQLSALDSASVEVVGSEFEVDGVPVGLGPIAATSGSLTGTLESGDPLSVDFTRDPGAVITLPEPGAGLLTLVALPYLAALGRRREHARP